MGKYLTLERFATLGLKIEVWRNVDPTQVIAAIGQGEADIDSVLAGRYRAPFTSTDPSVEMWNAHISAWHLLNFIGFNPNKGSDLTVRKRFEDAQKALHEVSVRLRHPVVIEASPPAALPQVNTSPKRGW